MMIDFLESLDHSITLAINGSNTPFLDSLMWIVSGKLIWIPFYLLLIFMFWKKTNFKQTFYFLLCAILVIAIVDLSSVHLFKNVFERYRPSHNLLLKDLLHFHEFENGNLYKGGTYGFVSSHAANFFGLGMFIYLAMRQYYSKILPYLIVAIILVGYSRIYLGVHYLSDVICGGLLGMLGAILVYHFVYLKISRNK